MENSLWKRLWTCLKTDDGMNGVVVDLKMALSNRNMYSSSYTCMSLTVHNLIENVLIKLAVLRGL
jgi:hypothetical protein